MIQGNSERYWGSGGGGGEGGGIGGAPPWSSAGLGKYEELSPRCPKNTFPEFSSH